MSQTILNEAIVESCRKCSFKYDFLLPNGKTVTVLCGQPPGVAYKAVSYLWENTTPLNLVCKKCSDIKAIPMRDAGKLWHILEFVRGGSKIWLDALSIDQDDPKDVASQLAVMGNIYRDAQVVSVMLPVGDKDAYELLKRLAITADEVVKRREEFGMVLDDDENKRPISTAATTVEVLAHRYKQLISQWAMDTGKWNYWGRAWTFQEWTMAAEIDISWEGIPGNESLQKIKNVVVSAASIIGHWRIQEGKMPCQGSEAVLLSQLAVRAEVSKSLNVVRMHFPFQDFLVADEIEDSAQLRGMTSLTPVHSISSGMSVETFKDMKKPFNLRRLLGLALTAISISKRRARYEADLVACWASMCNIEYNYDKDDPIAVALQKVVAALRKSGIPIFNFHANCYGGETDLKFMEYGAAMKHSNLASGAYMFGAPIFVGRVDTITHIRHCLEQLEEPVTLPCAFKVNLHNVEKAVIQASVPCTDRDRFLSAFKGIVSGTADGQEVRDVVDELRTLLDSTSTKVPGQLERHVLVPVSISCEDSGTSWDFDTWSICPSNIDISKLFVARESLKGTLVLAVPVDEKNAQIVSYLTMTHQRHGTYLIKTDQEGTADIVFRRLDPSLIEALSTMDFSAGPKPVDPDLMAIMSVPSWGLMDAFDEARNVPLTLGAKMCHVV